MDQVVIVSGARTAVGAFGGALKDVPAVDLAGDDELQGLDDLARDRDRIERPMRVNSW